MEKRLSRLEQRALKAYPISTSYLSESNGDGDRNHPRRLAFIEGYEQAEKDFGWISVNKRLPETCGYYFTCFNDYGYPQGVGVTRFDAATNEWIDDDDSYINVDYWMEVPKFNK